MELNPLFVNLIAIASIIGALLLGAWWIIGFYGVRNRANETELSESDMPGSAHETSTGIPPVLVIFYIFMGLSMLLYVLYIWLGGVSY